ncbi:proline--tRNA ligase, partial [Pseudoalteromonas aliena]
LAPVGLSMPIIVHRTANVMPDFVAGANNDDEHFSGINSDRDVTNYDVADIRIIVEGDASPCAQGNLQII